MRTPKSVEEYFTWFPPETQEAMNQVKNAILKVVPQAEETISYAMPTYKYKGLLAHFAAYKKHIGLYPGPKAVEIFGDDITGYKSAKGSIQFPLNKPMPLELISKIVASRLAENLKEQKKAK